MPDSNSEDLSQDLRKGLAQLDDRQRRIVGGVLAVMFKHPERVREREWISEQFTEIALLAGDWGDLDGVSDGVESIRNYAREHIDLLLNLCYRLFLRVAEDLSRQEDPRPDQAMLQALSYFPDVEASDSRD